MAKYQTNISATPGEDLTQHPLKKFPFHRETEIDRKRQYEALYNRSKEQCQEEDKLINEMKRIESVCAWKEKD